MHRRSEFFSQLVMSFGFYLLGSVHSEKQLFDELTELSAFKVKRAAP